MTQKKGGGTMLFSYSFKTLTTSWIPVKIISAFNINTMESLALGITALSYFSSKRSRNFFSTSDRSRPLKMIPGLWPKNKNRSLV